MGLGLSRFRVCPSFISHALAAHPGPQAGEDVLRALRASVLGLGAGRKGSLEELRQDETGGGGGPLAPPHSVSCLPGLSVPPSLLGPHLAVCRARPRSGVGSWGGPCSGAAPVHPWRGGRGSGEDMPPGALLRL